MNFSENMLCIGVYDWLHVHVRPRLLNFESLHHAACIVSKSAELHDEWHNYVIYIHQLPANSWNIETSQRMQELWPSSPRNCESDLLIGMLDSFEAQTPLYYSVALTPEVVALKGLFSNVYACMYVCIYMYVYIY